MGKNPWEEPDQEALALAATMQARKPRRWLRLLIGLVVVATLTFVAAYYVPLFRAHDALRAEYQGLSERRRVLAETLLTKERELERVRREKATLQGKLDDISAREKRRKQALEQLRTSISSKLRADETKGLAGTTIADGSVEVVLHNRLVFSPHTLTIPSKATSRLCDIVGASQGFELEVVSVTNDDEPPSVLLAAKYPTRAELSAVRAAVVGNRLGQACGSGAGQTSTTGIVSEGKLKLAGVKLPVTMLKLTPSSK